MKKILLFSLIIIISGCKENSNTYHLHGISSSDGSGTSCKSIKKNPQSCETLAEKDNCTGAQQQALCGINTDIDNNGYICDTPFALKEKKCKAP